MTAPSVKPPPPPVGAWVQLARSELQSVVDELRGRGYRTILPRVADGAVIYDDVTAIDELPRGLIDEQDGGKYRLRPSGHDGCFDYVVGPHSAKQYLFPPLETVLHGERQGDRWTFQTPTENEPPLAIVGVRACDLAAIAIQDRVFLEGPYVDRAYEARRAKLFLVAVNCRRAAATCFCHSMNTGPAATSGFDLALTEVDDRFVVQIGSVIGGEIVAAGAWSPCSPTEIDDARGIPAGLEQKMQAGHRGYATDPPAAATTTEQSRPRELDTTGIRDLLVGNLDHPRWDQVAERCLSCANCTMVCPTCFCSTVEDVSDLTGDNVRRDRAWASCFTSEHSYLSSGVVRKTTRSQYRQWLVHKLGTWIDQFGVSGCVGCGRCITWCPGGIDLTEELAAIRGDQP